MGMCSWSSFPVHREKGCSHRACVEAGTEEKWCLRKVAVILVNVSGLVSLNCIRGNERANLTFTIAVKVCSLGNCQYLSSNQQSWCVCSWGYLAVLLTSRGSEPSSVFCFRQSTVQGEDTDLHNNLKINPVATASGNFLGKFVRLFNINTGFQRYILLNYSFDKTP